MDTAVFALRMALAAVFIAAGVGKLLDLQGSRQAMRDFGLPRNIADVAGVALPLAELIAAVALVIRPTAQLGAALALILLLGFIAGIGNALRQGTAPDCHCFGQIHSAPAGRGTLIRNGVLALFALFAIIEGTGPTVNGWVNARSPAELVAVGIGAVAAILAIYAAQLWAEARSLRQNMGAAQRMAAAAPPGLPVGAIAPEFALQNVHGDEISLSALLGGDRPVLLIFASPFCGSCAELFPNIRRWQATLAERITIAIISSGSFKDNRGLYDEHKLDRLLIQKDAELIESYRIRGTPTAILIESDGKITSVPAEGVFGIEPMIRSVLRRQPTGPRVAEGSVA